MSRMSWVVVALAGVVGTAACQYHASTSASHPGVVSVERGFYLTTVLACNDCHTPFTVGPNGPEPDMSRMLSGHPQDLKMPPPPVLGESWMWAGAGTNTAYAGPWGISYASNLTPDENTGLGIWTEEMFVQALRTGRHMGRSREILPPMPWPAYAHLTDDDLKSVYVYLRSIPPIENLVPDAVIAGAAEGESWSD